MTFGSHTQTIRHFFGTTDPWSGHSSARQQKGKKCNAKQSLRKRRLFRAERRKQEESMTGILWRGACLDKGVIWLKEGWTSGGRRMDRRERDGERESIQEVSELCKCERASSWNRVGGLGSAWNLVIVLQVWLNISQEPPTFPGRV